jgi:uncharacterized metal-binding protein YceD (DUF177 family)
MSDLPFSRPVSIKDVSPGGTRFSISAEPNERAALAVLLKLPEVKRLEARFEVKPWKRDGLAITGTVEGEVTQICGVTLEEFEAPVREDVDVRFVGEDAKPRQQDVPGAEFEADLDAPDMLENGRVDLGALAAEHLALGLDPYPRKPELAAAEEPPEDEPEPATHRPFAGLDKLVAKAKPKKK